MKFLYIAPRYHTNQMAVMKGLREHGHEVCFISHYTAIIEDYDCVQPIVLGYALWYRAFDWLYVNVLHRRDLDANVFKIRHGFPPVRKLWRTIEAFRPDVVILREKSVYSMAAYLCCRRRGYPCILYNQSPYLSEPEKTDFAHRLVDRFSPRMRMTPVYGIQKPGVTAKKNDFYIPFVAEAKLGPSQREYFADDAVHILCVGKYEPRKHHLMLLEAVERLRGTYRIKAVLIGEATGRLQKEHHAQVTAYVKEHRLEDCVTVRTNVPRRDMDAEYAAADIFVIPSTREPASVSQLEAMGFSLPVICGDKNGTACYVEDGVTGYQFRDCDGEDFCRKLELLVSDREAVRRMGAAGYRAVEEKYSFRQYYDGIMEILGKIQKEGI